MSIDFSFGVRFILLALAVFRVAEMFVFDNGPANLFWKLRAWTGMYDRDADGDPYANATPLQVNVGALLSCVHCFSVWLAFPAALMLFFVSFAPEGIGWLWLGVVWLALAGAVSVIETRGGRN